MTDEIVAAYDAFDEILRDFEREVATFRGQMKDGVDDIGYTVDSMADAWKGNGYTDFRSNMRNKLDSIEASLDRCRNLEKLLNDAAVQLEEALTLLREKS